MSKILNSKILLIILAVQVGLLAILQNSSTSLAVNTKRQEFFSLPKNDLQELQLEEAGKSLIIKKDAGQWVLADLENLPANQVKVEQVIGELLALKTSAPVATSLGAAKQLKTGDQDYEKKVVLKTAAAEQKILFGTTPSFKKIYARIAGTDQTYILDYQASDLSAKAENWYTPDLLSLEKDQLEAVSFKDLVLEKGDTGLTLPEVAPGKVINEKELKGFLTKLCDISYQSLPDKKVPAGWKDAPEVVTYTLKVAGQDRKYQIKGPIKEPKAEQVEGQDGGKYYLQTSHLPYYFELSKYEVDSLTAFALAKILQDAEAPVASPAPEADK